MGAVFDAARRPKTVARKIVPPKTVSYEELRYVGITLNCCKIIRDSDYLSIEFQEKWLQFYKLC